MKLRHCPAVSGTAYSKMEPSGFASVGLCDHSVGITDRRGQGQSRTDGGIRRVFVKRDT
jgi:hypothetical protein